MQTHCNVGIRLKVRAFRSSGHARAATTELAAGCRDQDFGTLTARCTGGNIWLKNWSEANNKAGGNPNVAMYLGGYFGFGVGSAALVVVQTLILWIFCSIEVRQTPPHAAAMRLSQTLSCMPPSA